VKAEEVRDELPFEDSGLGVEGGADGEVAEFITELEGCGPFLTGRQVEFQVAQFGQRDGLLQAFTGLANGGEGAGT